MKKVIITIIALAVVATGVMFAVAQRSGHDNKGAWGKHGGHHRGSGMAFRGLDLTVEQKAQVKQIFETSKGKTQPLREAMKANREKMEAATANGAFDEAQVTALATEKGNLSAQFAVEMARVKSQTFAILTGAQKVKLAEMKTNRVERFKSRKAEKAEKISE